MSKLIIVSNRLPVTVERQGENFEYHKSLGGLATGLKSYHEKADSLWIGWPGINSNQLDENDKEEIRKKLEKEHGCLPVFLSEEEKEDYYEGFCNNTIWPLFHYFANKVEFNPYTWEAYKHVNK